MDTQTHWQDLYRKKSERETSWFRPKLDTSLALIEGLALAAKAPVIDVGAGRSTLVDDLSERGLAVTAVDLSEAALSASKSRLGAQADKVKWIVGDVLSVPLPNAHFAVWHDRAVFHFLTDAGQRARYAKRAASAVRPGGYLIVASFAPDGPAKCSGLDVCRYDGAGLEREFSEGFALDFDEREDHRTPAGAVQRFTYAVLKRRES